ncbi:hypothetical protein B9Z55_013085 [Caenorhabditis nigoni]|uniref:DUF38 domain-containing protein n=1 Tax=Caenorhabditis nigoni TaxID=1611254 RepID=A0A2G5U0M8_9PELO|nr:hypothetical protein B9Z55_013085 [Caenorhabditis nigoni]
MTIKSTNCRQEAVKFAEKMIRKGRHDLEKLIIGLENYPFDNSQMKLLPHCKTTRIGVSNNDQVWWWLQWLPEDNLDIWIFPFEDIASALVLTS